ADFTGYPQRQIVGGVAFKGFYTRNALARCIPEGFFPDAIGCYCTQPCNNHASLCLMYHRCFPLRHLSCLLNYLRAWISYIVVVIPCGHHVIITSMSFPAIAYQPSLAVRERGRYSHRQNRWNVIRPR